MPRLRGGDHVTGKRPGPPRNHRPPLRCLPRKSLRQDECNRVFAERYPDIPTPGLADRDFAGFSVRQRELVQRLLLAGRLSLATTARLEDGTELLVTHAGVTVRELDGLGVPADAPARRIAEALEALLARAVDRCRDAWSVGEAAPLDLAPVGVSGTTGQEGGGLLYHRPANPDRPDIRDRRWEWDAARPRRFDPRRLPRGLVQVAGHTPHPRLRREFVGWLGDGADADLPGTLRTLVVDGDSVRYHPGMIPPPPGAAVLYLVDGEAHRAAPEAYRVLEVAALDLPAGRCPRSTVNGGAEPGLRVHPRPVGTPERGGADPTRGEGTDP